jgi:CTP:molybdopterin cytidylyltransferase MocA
VTAAVVLAAGSGTRLGGCAKALLLHEGRTFLEHIVETVEAIRGGPVIVVVGPPYGDEVAAHARTLEAKFEIKIVTNPDPSRGMASSVALGFAALQPWSRLAPVRDALLWPVDHPFVKAATLEALMQPLYADVVRPVYLGRGGHPPLISRGRWKRFAACDQVDGGARGVMATLRVIDVVVDDPAVVRDIDTPDDRQALT